MLASMAERKQYRGNHAANLILFYNYYFVISTLISVLNFFTFRFYSYYSLICIDLSTFF